MNTNFLLQRHYGANETYEFNEAKHKLENNIAKQYQAIGFVISTRDLKNFYSGLSTVNDEIEHIFEEGFNPEITLLYNNPDEIIDVAQSINKPLCISVVYLDKFNKNTDEYLIFKLPILIEINIDLTGVRHRIQPLEIFPNIPSFSWESELVKNDINFLGLSYTKVKSFMANKGYDLELDVLLGLLRIYKGSAIDFIIYDVLEKTNDIGILSVIHDQPLGSVNARKYVKACIKALISHSPKPEHPFHKFLPYLQDSVYINTLTINCCAQFLITIIEKNVKYSNGRPYTAEMDMPLGILKFSFSLLDTTDSEYINNRQYKDLKVVINYDLDGRNFYNGTPHEAVAALKKCIQLSDELLTKQEYAIISKLDVLENVKVQKDDLKARIAEIIACNDSLHVKRLHLETSLPSEKRLGVMKMNLRNIKAKIEKHQTAFKKGKMKVAEYEVKLNQFQEKYDTLDAVIQESKSTFFEEMRIEMEQILQDLQENEVKLNLLNSELSKLPRNFEYSDMLRNFFKPL